MKKRILALVAVAAFALAACGIKPLITTQKLLSVAGRQFVSLGATFNTMCAVDATPKMDAKTCQDWKEFAPKYQEVDAEVRKLWTDVAACELAKAEMGDSRDCKDKDELIDTVIEVKNTLANYAFKALATQQEAR